MSQRLRKGTWKDKVVNLFLTVRAFFPPPLLGQRKSENVNGGKDIFSQILYTSVSVWSFPSFHFQGEKKLKHTILICPFFKNRWRQDLFEAVAMEKLFNWRIITRAKSHTIWGLILQLLPHAKLPLKSTCYHTFLASQEEKKNLYFTPTKRKKKNCLRNTAERIGFFSKILFFQATL